MPAFRASGGSGHAATTAVKLATDCTMSPTYFTNASGPGPVRYGQLPCSIGVLEALDKPMPIGMAWEFGWTEEGLALRRLRVHGAEIPGQWLIIDGRFVGRGQSER